MENRAESGKKHAFIIGGDKPLSYQQIRRMRGRIKKDTGFNDDIVPRRFRTTVLTDLYDQTKDIKQTQAAAGHTTADMTLNLLYLNLSSFVQSRNTQNDERKDSWSRRSPRCHEQHRGSHRFSGLVLAGCQENATMSCRRDRCQRV